LKTIYQLDHNEKFSIYSPGDRNNHDKEINFITINIVDFINKYILDKLTL